MQLPNHIQKILKQRYLKGNESNWEDIVERVIDHVAFAEKFEKREWFKDIARELILPMHFVPGGRILSESGFSNQLMNCAVLPINNSLDEIFKETIYSEMRLYSRSGSAGYDFSKLTARGEKTNRGYAAGPVAFVDLISKVASTIYQESTRNPGSMGIIRVDHKDIKEFLNAKFNLNKINQVVVDAYEEYLSSIITDAKVFDKAIDKLSRLLVEKLQLPNFNLSVAITDEFMYATKTGNIELFDLIAQRAWVNGEPGIIFIDEVNRKHPIPDVVSASNVCAEQMLLPYESCCLGSINLNSTKALTERKFQQLVEFGVRFLDNVIDVTTYAVPEFEKMQKRHRKIGLGVMGWADHLLKAGIRYGSVDSLSLARVISGKLKKYSYVASEKLAQEKGYNARTWAKILEKNKTLKDPFTKKGIPRRNVALNTVAPVGTGALIAQTSGGIEPVFDWRFTRYDETAPGGQVYDWHPEVIKYCENSKVNDIEYYVNSEKLPDRFVTALELTPIEHVNMVAAWQENIDSSISKTVNMAKDATVEEVKDVIFYAYKKGCKALSIYRSGSRDFEVLKKVEKSGNVESKDEVKSESKGVSKTTTKTKSTNIRNATVHSIPTGQSTLHVTISRDAKDAPMEIFCNISKAGSDEAASTEAMGKILSKWLQSCNTKEEAYKVLGVVVAQLRGIGGETHIFHNGGAVKSVWDGLSKIITQYLHLPEAIKEDSLTVSNAVVYNSEDKDLVTCKECKTTFHSIDKCPVCPECGFSNCGE